MRVVVATDPEAGVLWAKAANSLAEAKALVLDDILRIIEEMCPKVTVSEHEDGYGEWLIVVEYDEDCSLEYKIMEDKEDA